MNKIISIVLLSFACHAGFAQTSDGYADLVEEVLPSVVLVRTYDAAGNGLKRGTGFCAAPNLFITNHHVVEGASKITITTSDDRTFVVTPNATNAGADLALLKSSNDTSIKSLRFAAGLPKVGEKIIVVGNPLGLTGTVSDGIVSALRDADSEFVQITAPISSGSSGSPVINRRGEVIGLATLNLKGGQNLNFAISSRFIQTLWPGVFVVAPTRTSNKFMPASRWRLLNNSETTYDKQTLNKSGNIISVWINYAEKSGTSEKAFTEIDCSTRKIRTGHSVTYDGDGSVLRSTTNQAEWRPIIPDSNAEGYFQIFCEGEPDRQTEIEANELLNKAIELEKANDLPAAKEAYWELLRFVAEYRNKQKRVSMVFLRINEISAESNLKEILEKTNDREGFESFYNFQISNGDESSYVKLAALYKESGMLVKFRSTVQKAIGIYERKLISNNSAYYDFTSLADLYSLYDLDGKAIDTLIRANKKFPTEEAVTLRLAPLYNKYKRYRENIDLINRTLPHANFFRTILLGDLKTAYQGIGDRVNVEKIELELNTVN